MDGLGSDVDVTFLLTTNRADLLEQVTALIAWHNRELFLKLDEAAKDAVGSWYLS